MDLAELLNLAVESHHMFEAIDQGIYEAVTEARRRQEERKSLQVVRMYLSST